MNQLQKAPDENLTALATTLQGKSRELGLAMLAFKGDGNSLSEISEISQMSDVEFDAYNQIRLSLVEKILALETETAEIRTAIRTTTRMN
ncbi:MAG: hypothetical protein WCV72_02500 [Patescibacteria group bacterium]|jgi:hypothetical protein